MTSLVEVISNFDGQHFLLLQFRDFRLTEKDLCDKTEYDIMTIMLLSLHGLRGFKDQRCYIISLQMTLQVKSHVCGKNTGFRGCELPVPFYPFVWFAQNDEKILGKVLPI